MSSSQYSHLLYDTLWDHALLGVSLVAKDGVFLAANPAFCKWVEYTEAELRTKKYQDITHPDDVAFDSLMSGELLLGKIEGYDMPKRYLTKFGRVINMMSRVAAIHEKTESNGEQFVCFLSQMAPLSEHQIHSSHTVTAATVKVHNKLFWRSIITHWPAIMFGIGLAVSITVQVLERIL